MKTLFTRFLAVVSFGFLLVGCVDKNFDLDDINKEITVGQDQTLDLPLGYFMEQTLDQIISLDKVDHLKIDSQGNYVMDLDKKDGNVSIDFSSTSTVLPIASQCAVKISGLDVGYSGPIPAGTVTGNVSANANIEVSGTFPTYVSKISRVFLKPDNGAKACSMTVAMKLNSMAAANAGSSFKVKVTAPAGIKFCNQDGTTLGTSEYQQTVSIAEGSNETSFNVWFKEIVLNDGDYTLSGGNFTYSSTFSYSVDYTFQAKDATVNITAVPSLSLSAVLNYQGADLVLNEHSMEVSSTEVNIGSLSDDFDITVDNLDVNPKIYLTAENTFPVGGKADVTVSTATETVKVTDVALSAATWADGSMTAKGVSNIVLARQDPHESYTFYACDITKLFKGKIPEKLNVKVEVKSMAGSYTLYTSDSYNIAYSYAVNMPLSFGPNFNISYADTVSGLGSTVKDLKNMSVGEVYLVGHISNSTPLDFTVNDGDITFKDNAGNDVPASMVRIKVVEGRINGSADGSIKQSTILLQLIVKDNKLENLSSVEKVAFKFKATSNGAGVPLSKSQKMYGDLAIRIIDGVTVDLDNI